MTDGAATMVRPDRAAARRLSPKVRRLLAAHALDHGQVDGTGGHGRVTPEDVARVVRGDATPPPAARLRRAEGVLLASPAARRLLRDAGVALADVAADGPVTRAVARALVDGTTTAATPDTTTRRAVDVDLTRLLFSVARARDEARRRTGIELTPLAPLAHAVCRVLRRHPELHAGAAGRPSTAPAPDVDLGVVVATDEGPSVVVVACAQDLNATALASRLVGRAGGGEPGTPHLVVVGDGWHAPPSTSRSLGRGSMVVRVDVATPQDVHVLDEIGGTATTTRWVASVHLEHGGEQTSGARFLDDLRRELETVELLPDLA